MPGAIVKRNKLHHVTITSDQQMSGNPEIDNFAKIGMRVGIETIGKKIADMRTAELTGRQADIVDHQQR